MNLWYGQLWGASPMLVMAIGLTLEFSSWIHHECPCPASSLCSDGTYLQLPDRFRSIGRIQVVPLVYDFWWITFWFNILSVLQFVSPACVTWRACQCYNDFTWYMPGYLGRVLDCWQRHSLPVPNSIIEPSQFNNHKEIKYFIHRHCKTFDLNQNVAISKVLEYGGLLGDACALRWSAQRPWQRMYLRSCYRGQYVRPIFEWWAVQYVRR